MVVLVKALKMELYLMYLWWPARACDGDEGDVYGEEEMVNL